MKAALLILILAGTAYADDMRDWRQERRRYQRDYDRTVRHNRCDFTRAIWPYAWLVRVTSKSPLKSPTKSTPKTDR